MQLRFSRREGGWGLEQMLCLVIREDPLTNILAELCLWEPGFGIAAAAVFSVKTLLNLKVILTFCLLWL